MLQGTVKALRLSSVFVILMGNEVFTCFQEVLHFIIPEIKNNCQRIRKKQRFYVVLFYMDISGQAALNTDTTK
jgi:hypothetical protein